VKQSETDEQAASQDLGAGSREDAQEEMPALAAGHISGIGGAAP
jgi:hypothetical protein